MLNRRTDATEAFGSLVKYGLAANKLSVRLLFKPGTTQFLDELRSIASGDQQAQLADHRKRALNAFSR